MNVPPSITRAVSSGRVSYGELASVLGIEDLHDVLEIMMVEAHNRKVAAAQRTPEE